MLKILDSEGLIQEDTELQLIVTVERRIEKRKKRRRKEIEERGRK